MGIPPFGGFFGKYLVLIGPVKDGHIVIAFAFIICAFLTILYLLRVFTFVFLGETAANAAKEKSPLMVFCVALLAFLSLAGGILIQYPSLLVESIVRQMGLRM